MFAFGDSFDLYAATADMFAGYWEFTGNPSGFYGLTTPGRFGGRCMYSYWQGSLNGNNTLTKSSGQNDAVHHITCAFMQGAVISGTTLGFSLCLMDGTTPQCSINFRSDGAITLTSGLYNGAVLATYTGAVLLSNQWYALEFEVVINNTTGSFTVRSSGSATNSFQATGLNTRGGSTNNYANNLALNFGGAVNYQYLDDLLWRSDPSSVPWVGDIRCYTRMPVSDQSVQFTPTGTRSVVFGASSGLGLVANRAWYGAFTPLSNSTISTIAFQSGPISGNLKCAIFTDNAGAPGNLVATATAPLVAPSSGANFTFSPAASVTGGVKYWVGFCISGTGGSLAGGLPADGYFSDATAYASWPPATVVTLTAGGTRAVGSTITLVPSTNAGLVAELPQDGTATYVSDSVVGDRDFYGIAARNSPAPPASTVVITTRGFMQRSDAGSRTAAMQIKSGATTVQSPSLQPASGSFSWLWRTDLTDPNTGAAWAPSAVDAVQVGPRIIS